MKSGLVVLSEPNWGCYPWKESIQSFLPVVDEIVVAFNVYGREDGSEEELRELQKQFPKIRIVATVFDIERYGWVTYGIARTMGYQACKGNLVLMFDADGILHEEDAETIITESYRFLNDKKCMGYWNKFRIYGPNIYWDQHKHSGIYNKGLLGDRFDFFRPDGKGAPNSSRLDENETKSRSLTPPLFGYEHVWDTKQVLQYKTARYGRMIDSLYGYPIKTDEEYFDIYMKDLVKSLKERGRSMEIEKHPAIIQEKLKTLNETHFGFNHFGYK